MGNFARILPSLTGAFLPHTFNIGIANISQTVFIDKSLPLEVRYLAIIQFKNGIDKYWRKTAAKFVDGDKLRGGIADSVKCS